MASSPESRLIWYRRLVVAGFLYGLTAIFLSLWPTIQLIGRPYGGFLWSWDNQRGLYRVDETYVSSLSPLKTADFIHGIAGSPAAGPTLSSQAQLLYDQATAVCSPNTAPQALPTLDYIIERSSETAILTAPIECFNWTTWLGIIALPTILSFLIWGLGLIVYRARPLAELNLTFALFTSFSAAVVAKQVFHEPGIHTPFSQAVALLIATPAPVISAALFLHLTTALPRPLIFQPLRRLAWLWYGLLPIMLLIVGGLHFLLAPIWTPWIGDAGNVFGLGTILLRYSGPILLYGRCLYLIRHAPLRQTQNQARLILVSMLPALLLIPYEITLHSPGLARWWLPVSQTALLFWTGLSFIGLAFTILRYQLFPGRMSALYMLAILFVVVIVSLLAIPGLRRQPELSPVLLFVLLLGLSLFWNLPNPFQRTLQRFALPGLIRETELVQFSLATQGVADQETLPLLIVQTVEKHLELSFAALWLTAATGIAILESFTDQAPAGRLPVEIPLDMVWQTGAQRLKQGPLRDAGCEIALFLHVNEQKIGILGLGPRWTEDVFDETDLVTLAALGHQAALSLHTAQQIQTLERVPLQVEQAQLDERERIAQDLHDTTQAKLTQLNFTLDRVGRHLDDPVAAERLLEICVQDVNSAARELRGILRALAPLRLASRPPLDGLLEDVARAQNHHPEIKITAEIDGQVTAVLPAKQQEVLWRVCQQALENALRHSQSSVIKITVTHCAHPHQIAFSIIDDGCGFSTDSLTELAAQGHFGLYIMAARLERVGGTLHIDSAHGQGTTITGILPISQAAG